MDNKIEKLKTDVDGIKNSLNELKNNVSLSEDEKKKQAENLKFKAETTKKKIEKEIHSLESKTDDESKKQKEEAETLLDSFNEIMSLYASILNSKESEEGEEEIQEEKKGFFKKTKEWVGEQWDDVWNKEKWKEEGGKNLLRTAGFTLTIAGTGVLIYKGIRKIFGVDYEKEISGYKDMSRKEKREARKEYRKQKRRERREKRKGGEKSESFWERPIGKAIKWTAIGTGVYYVVHGLKTGKWDLSHSLDWSENSPSSEAEDVYNDYNEFAEKNPEKYKEYEKIGENINLMYDQIWDTERNYFGDDSQIVMGEIGNQVEEKKLKKNEKFEHIDTKGMVVYSLDNFYTDVGQLLSYGGVEKYLRCKTIEEYKIKIKSFGAEWFDKAMVPFLSGFANFASFGIVSKDTAQQKMDKYFKGISENAGDSLYELDLFFRQYTKVLTYMADKKNAIALQEARKIISAEGYDGKSWPTNVSDQNDMLNEAINDRAWVEKKLKGTTYGAFMSSNILRASRILKNEGLDGSEMTEELEAVVSGLDKQTEKIIGGFEDNALKKAESKLNNGESLDSNDKNGLHKIAQNIVDDMGDETNPGWIYNTFDYFFEAFDTKDADKKMILEASGLPKCFNKIVSAIQKLQSEISVNPTKENIELLRNLVGQYTSLKKELAVAIYAIKEAKESKDGLDKLLSFGKFIGGFFSHFVGSMKKLFHLKADIGDFINIFAGLTVTGGIVEIAGRIRGKPWAMKLGRYTKKTGLFPCALVELGLSHTSWGWAVKHRINDIAKTNPTKAENLMKMGILDGVLSPKQVGKIIGKNKEIKNSLCIYNSESDEKVFQAVVDNIFGDTYKTQAKLFVKYYGKIDTKCLIHCSNDKSLRGLNNKMFKVDVLDEPFKSLDNFDKEFEKLCKDFGSNSVQKSYFEAMLKKVNEGADIDFLTDLMKKEEFRKAITTDNLKVLKELKISELKKLYETGKLEDFASGKIKINGLMSSVPRFAKSGKTTVETVENTGKGIAEMEQEVRRLQLEFDNKKAKFDDLYYQVREAEGSAGADLMREYEEAEKAWKSAEAELDTAKAQLSAARGKAVEVENTGKGISEMKKAAERLEGELANEVERLEGELKKKTALYEKVRDELHYQSGEIEFKRDDTHMKEYEEVEKEMKNTEAELKKAKRKLQARQTFNKEIDKAIDSLHHAGDSESKIVKIVTPKLEALESDKSLLDDEMECFTKFMRDGFDAKLIPEMQKLMKIEKLDAGEKIGAKLKKLLADGDYGKFKSLLMNPEHVKAFKNIKIDDIVKNFDNILNKAGGIGGDAAKSLFKSFAKILAKVLP